MYVWFLHAHVFTLICAAAQGFNTMVWCVCFLMAAGVSVALPQQLLCVLFLTTKAAIVSCSHACSSSSSSSSSLLFATGGIVVVATLKHADNILKVSVASRAMNVWFVTCGVTCDVLCMMCDMWFVCYKYMMCNVQCVMCNV